MKIVPLTRAHLVEWFGDRGQEPTFKGVAGLVDDKLAAIGGVRFIGGRLVAFCGVRDEARRFPKALHQAAKQLFADLGKHHARIIAERDDDEPNSARWLERLGFRPDDDGIWVWRNGRQ